MQFNRFFSDHQPQPGARNVLRINPPMEGFKEVWEIDLRYKRPRGERSILLSHIFRAPAPGTRPSPNFTWASAVAEFGLLLRQSQFRGQASPEALLERAQAAIGDDEQGYRTEFLGLVRRYQELQYRSAR